MPLTDDVSSVTVTEKEEQDLLGEPPAPTHGVPSTSSGNHSALQQLVPVMAQIAESLKVLGKTPPPPPPRPIKPLKYLVKEQINNTCNREMRN